MMMEYNGYKNSDDEDDKLAPYINYSDGRLFTTDVSAKFKIT